MTVQTRIMPKTMGFYKQSVEENSESRNGQKTRIVKYLIKKILEG